MRDFIVRRIMSGGLTDTDTILVEMDGISPAVDYPNPALNLAAYFLVRTSHNSCYSFINDAPFLFVSSDFVFPTVYINRGQEKENINDNDRLVLFSLPRSFKSI